jgi:tRNA(Ser,Leu) C12 N-acetylase TAN1
MNYNLLATCEPINVSRACGELWINLRAAGDDAPRVNRSKVKGLILSRTFLDPVKAIHELRLLMEKQPNRFKMVNRVMPILGWVQTDVPSIVEGVRVQSTRIQKEESFRVTLEKRAREP